MSKLATELIFDSTQSTVTLPIYSSTTISMGSLMRLKTGATVVENYIGPFQIGLARPFETSTSIPISHLHVVDYSNDIQWVFGSDNATAAHARRISFFEYNKPLSQYSWKGFINITPGTAATANTVRGFRVLYQPYTIGTVTVSGTGVTGTDTAWVTNQICNGSRIGFGSSAATDITVWYEISAVTSNTAITLSSSAGTSGSPINYIIEDLKLAIVTTNATLTNGGLFLVKGLRYETFAVNGTTITSATTDNQRAVYWLADTNPLTNTAGAGIALEEFNEDGNGWTNQPCYILDTNTRVYKYNLRAPLTGLVGGKNLTSLILSSGTQSITGTLSQNNNGRIGRLQHGPGANVLSLYWVTTTRIFRAAISGITNNSTTYQSDAMVEIPPGSTSTFAATGALNNVEIMSNIDRLCILSTHAAGIRSYISQYRADSGQMDLVFLGDTKQIDQSLADSDATPFPNTQSVTFGAWSENGYMHFVRQGTTAIISQLYSVPIAAHWSYTNTSNQRVITPKMSTTNATTYYRAYVNSEQSVGSETLGMQSESYRLYARTSGIDDNSGSWTLLDDKGSLTAMIPSDYIQFMIEFKTISFTCIPGRIHNICVVYEDDATDSHYQPSVVNSDALNKRFAWRFSTAFGTTVPNLEVKLYDAVSGGILVTDTTDSPVGTFEKSTNDGGAWGIYNATDKGNETTYIRYTPLSLGDNIKVKALLTQA